MKDNFDIYEWKQNPNSQLQKSEKFDLYEWNKKRYLGELDISDDEEDENVNATNLSGDVNITRGGDDPRTGAEQESDKNVVGENQSDLESLSKYLKKRHPSLRFDIRDEPYFDRIDVRGSQQDLMDFGRKMHGEKFGKYEVFAIDDDDRGEEFVWLHCRGLFAQ